MSPDDDRAWWLPDLLFLVFVALTLFGLVWAVPGCSTAPRGRTPAEQAAGAVEVAVACTQPDGKWSLQQGSGVIVGRHHALTASHVIACRIRAVVTVILADGQQIPADVDLISLRSDLARLELRADVPLRPAVRAKAEMGVRVCVVHARPRRGRACGTVTSLSDGELADIGTDGRTIPGNSGSGLYDDAGRLVGVVTHKCTVGRCTYAASVYSKAWAEGAR